MKLYRDNTIFSQLECVNNTNKDRNLSKGCANQGGNKDDDTIYWKKNTVTNNVVNRRDILSFQSKRSHYFSDHSKKGDNEIAMRESLNTAVSTLLVIIFSYCQPTYAKRSFKSRDDDSYKVQKSDTEWKAQLSDMQYFVLRQGGTENPYFSILENEYRSGIFSCAGCGTDLFNSNSKFHSGTGWPSFARGIDDNVEVIDEGTAASLMGKELRCKTCGGHLGDVFPDGFLFVGSPAFLTGKRFCIDGSALVFRPTTIGMESTDVTVRGDVAKKIDEIPSWFDPS